MRGWSDRRRAWLLTLCALTIVLTYLAGWTAYAYNGLSDYGRNRQLGRGEVGSSRGVAFRLLSLGSATALRDADGTRTVPAVPGASWVVAEVEATIHDRSLEYPCSLLLVGPDRRRYDTGNLEVPSRTLPTSCNATEMPLDQPYRFEAIYLVPNADLTSIYGLEATDPGRPGVELILRPPA